VLSLALAGAGAFWLLRSQHAPPSPAAVAPAPVAVARFDVRQATEAEIDEHVPSSLTVFRLADQPRILVLDFASLHQQGEMLNRVAVFVEKAGLPHDRVLSDSELDAAIRARGDTVETFYFGHDYSAQALLRFFAGADDEDVQLNPEEQKLRALLHQEGWLSPSVAAGLISVPAVGADPRITASARSTILRHELSHGEFFSNPQYAEYVHKFWESALTGDERAAVRAFLTREGYDSGNEALMYNEMQAYLMFTRDPLFFSSDMVGMTLERLTALRVAFLSGMPDGWLRHVLASYGDATSPR
jgi:hypothetical protein